ncbi:Protein sidekick-2 [Galemys pyrenaicus]|uniref:Protein sidekick-2 n=1 Tax=Galemys pyrenaicus TaxID=202257 RepID=A0A8J6DG86_GALPY|nr:Protein sidekick-2 [Galemys pyrenaicus]
MSWSSQSMAAGAAAAWDMVTQLADDVAPYFKTEPVRTQVHLEGNRLVLTCMAEGSWPLEFKWLHNNRELTKFSLEYRQASLLPPPWVPGGGRYMITSLDRTHAGFYRCIVRNRMGALLQRQTEVQVAYMGSFEEGEKRQSVSHGEAAVIRAPRISSFPRPQVTWFRDGRKIPPSSRIAITLENTLVILSTVAPDAGRYYVQAVNDKNGDNKTSQPITLAVENVGGPADPIAPTIIIPPRNTSVVAGTSEVTMECVANARPLIKLHIIWRKDGVQLAGGISDYNRRLTIPNPSGSDSGYYECEAVLRSSSVPSVVRGAYLSVLEPPQFVKEPERHITAEMEKVVDVPCRAKGVPPPSITWYKDAALVEVEKLSRFRQRGDGNLQISGLVPDDTGMFQCFARNAAGEAQTSTYLAVTSIAPNITRGPLDSTVIDGMSVVLACETSGAPRPAITWQKGSHLRPQHVGCPQMDTVMETCSLTAPSRHQPSLGLAAGGDLPGPQPHPSRVPLPPMPGSRRYRSPVLLKVPAASEAWLRQETARGLSGEGQTARWAEAPGDLGSRLRAPRPYALLPTTKAETTTPHLSSEPLQHLQRERILASGSVQLPRFTLLESGSLLISPTHISDAGTYTCLATNSRGVDEASADLVVWARTRITKPPQDQSVIKGTQASMVCGVSHDPRVTVRYVWEKDGVTLGVESNPRIRLDKNGSLHISQTWSGDIGTYTCRVLSAGGNDSRSAHLRVRQLPHAPEHPVATLSPSERRAINLTWAKPFDGNSPLLRYVLEMSENNAPWTVLLASVDPEATSVMIKGLVPARSYQFRLCAVNDVGKGQFSKDTERVSLPEEPPTAPPQNVIASGRTNQSIMIQWQPPPESHQNGLLRGYIIRYCLAGLPVGYQFKNITDADVNNLLLEDLIIWTNYEIEVAAYNSAGLGVYSSKVTEWTLQGVPTVPPGNVHVEATNSTTIRFTWNAPSPQFINGINQGYKALMVIVIAIVAGLAVVLVVVAVVMAMVMRDGSDISGGSSGAGDGDNSGGDGDSKFATMVTALIAWEPKQEEEVTMVTARPNFQDSIHVGFVSGLKKFTEYFTSVLCFTTPGDGPRSTPQLVRTHEDVPGPVGHLSFNDILDTSLKVSWQEPGEKNGILTAPFHDPARIIKGPSLWPAIPPAVPPNRASTQVPLGPPHITPTSLGHTAPTATQGRSEKQSGRAKFLATATLVPPRGLSSGYRISWEEYNRTNTRVTHYLPNVTLEYRVTGLTALTTYTIEVAAMTAKGQGQVSASTISSGVPPELPGAPSNLGISNIGPRSVTLQFRPGYDGKTSISRWLVEAQVGMVGEGEEWLLIHQLPNEPDARSMEVPDLNPFTYYSFRMRQVNIVGTSPPSQPSRKIQTLQAPPDMAPANVTLRTASETSLWLRWMPLPEMEYNGNPESVGYKIKYSRADGHGKTLSHVVQDRVEREYTIEDLEEWTEYRVQLQAFNAIGSGPWSQTVMGRTRESVPSSGPTNVSALATTSSSMLVRWSEIPEADRNGLVLGYKGDLEEVLAGPAPGPKPSAPCWALQVIYKEKDSDSQPRFWLVEGNSSRSAQLTGLGKYVLYEVQVLAFTRIGDGSPSHPPVLERTLDDVPGPPMGILFPEVRTTSVRLIWQPPAAPNGIILAYQITHRLNATTASTATVEVLAPSARQFTATGLKPESVYLFRITAQTRKGWGEAAEALVVTTEKRDRPQPPSKPVVQQEDVKARSVLLAWEPGSDGLSPVRYYTVQTRELPGGRWALHSASVSHNASAFVVDRLKPFTSYKFRVKATNDIGDSEFSEESEPLTTLQAAPDDAPTIVSVTPHTTTSVLIQWQPPPEDKINGILLGFRIRYRELLYEGLRAFTLRGIHNPGAKWAELTPMYSMRNLSRPSLTQYELDNLNKHRRYEIRMSVYNAVGEGPSSAPQEVFVGEAVPTAAPRNVAVHGATATQLDVTWEPPPLESQNGDIQGYKIYFWEAERRNLTERLKTLFLAENGVKLKNLTGYTAYMVSVAAFNAAGDGPRSTPTRGQTQQAAPSAPGAVRFSELTTTSVNVSWEAPQSPNGILEGYRLVYEPCTPVDGVSKIVTVDVKGNGPLWLKVKDLAEGMTYRFRIRAKTFTYGPEIEANVTTGPGEGAPGPPGVPIIVRYSSAIAIHWSSGDPGQGPITRYVIEARPSDEGLWDVLIKDIPKEVTSYTFSMDILKPGVSYDFRVIAVNDYGFGAPSSPSQSVPAQRANPFYEEWWFLVVIALVGLIFILLLVFVLVIRGQSKKYAKKTDSGSSAKSGALSHGEMMSLDESSFPALELNNRRLSVKNSFCRKNGLYTRSPPRPSPGSLHYSDEDVAKYNDLIPAESSSLTEKPSEVSDSQGSDSEYEVDSTHQKAHSFVNHYISDPTYYNSWRRQQKGISRAQAYSYTESDSGDPDHPAVANSGGTQQGSLFRPKASRTPTPQNPPNPPSQQSTLYRPPSSLAPGSRAPIAAPRHVIPLLGLA